VPWPGPFGSSVVSHAPNVETTVPKSLSGATEKSCAVLDSSRMIECVLVSRNASESVVKLSA
jgi:hypothetical protein